MQHQRQQSQSPRIQLDTTKHQANKSIEVINLVSDSSQGSPMTIYKSNDPTAFMTTPAKKNTKNKEHVNRKFDKIINRIIHSPTKHQQENTQQRIKITPADNTSPNTELISILPAHQSTPVEPQLHITATTNQENPKDKTKDNNQLVINKPPINIFLIKQQATTNWQDNPQETSIGIISKTPKYCTATYPKSDKISTN